MTQKSTPQAKLPKAVIIRDAKTVSGRGRGKGLGVPTINIDLAAVPNDVAHGIYACRITLDGTVYPGAMHYGARPVFQDSDAFEVHIIEGTVETVPETATIEIVGYIREVQNFASPTELVERIQKDIQQARGMLSI